MRFAGSSSVSLANMITKRAATPGALAAQDAAHPLDHLAAGAARAHDDAEVGVGHVDAFVEHPGRRDGVELAHAEIVEDLPPLPACGRAGDEVDRDMRVEPVDRVVRGAHGLGEDQGAVGVLDGRREAAEQLVLRVGLRHDLTALGERVEVVARGAAVGAGVALGEVGDGGEEVTERFERHVADGAEVLAGAHEPLLDGEVLRPFLDRQRDTDERDAGRRAHAVGDRLFEPVAVADAAEVGEQELGHRVVAAFERRGQPEPFLVLLEQRRAAGPCRPCRGIRRR